MTKTFATTRTARLGLLLAIAGAGLMLGGCSTWPPERLDAINLGASQDFTLGRTALRGAGYKRLITTYAETHGLIDALDELEADVRAHSPLDERVLVDLADLRGDTETFRDEIRYKLDTRRREKWHRVQMGKLWYRYRKLNPEGMELHNAYKRERRVDTDEIRDRRTPLTGEMRFSPWGIERWRRQPWEQNMYATGGVPQIEKAPRWRGPWEYPDADGPVPQEHWGPDYRKGKTGAPAAAAQQPSTAPAPARSGSYMVPSSGTDGTGAPPRRLPEPPPPPAPPASGSSSSDVRVTNPAGTQPAEDEREPVIDLIDP